MPTQAKKQTTMQAPSVAFGGVRNPSPSTETKEKVIQDGEVMYGSERVWKGRSQPVVSVVVVRYYPLHEEGKTLRCSSPRVPV